jgi:GlcNAc-PI de-N-acetylase
VRISSRLPSLINAQIPSNRHQLPASDWPYSVQELVAGSVPQPASPYAARGLPKEEVHSTFSVEQPLGYASPGQSWMKTSRRQLIGLTIPAIAAAQTAPARRLNVVCVGGHPDDPESGCGGTLALYAGLGHTVTVIYLTRGEAGIPGKSHGEAAAIRTAECETSCKILGVKAVFAGQIDGATVVDAKAAEALGRLISAERPDIIVTWPIDTPGPSGGQHPDLPRLAGRRTTIPAVLLRSQPGLADYGLSSHELRRHHGRPREEKGCIVRAQAGAQ